MARNGGAAEKRGGGEREASEMNTTKYGKHEKMERARGTDAHEGGVVQKEGEREGPG